MQLLSYVSDFLAKPFPVNESMSGKFKTISIVSIFVTVFLYVFEPFGMNAVKENKFLICWGFGAMCILAYLIYEYGIARLLGIYKWKRKYTFGKFILDLILLMLCISLANFIYARLIFFGDIKWEHFPQMIFGTFAVGIFPTIVIGGMALLRQERKYKFIANELNNKPPIAQNDDTDKDLEIFDISYKQIKYVEALQNYVRIGYVNREGQFREKSERATLKSVLEILNHDAIVKCHRSYLVNKNAIISTDGNAQGLLLSLSNCDKQIPVSRSMVKAFRKNIA